MSSLYNIEAEYLYLVSLLEETGGELTPELEERLAIVQENFAQKSLNYCYVITKLEGEVHTAMNEVNRISQFIITKNNIVERLKTALLEAVKMFGTKDPNKDIWRYQTGTFRLGTRKSTSTEIYDPTVVEDRFKQISISKLTVEQKAKILEALEKDEQELSIKVDIPLTPIRAAIEAGETVEGAQLRTNYSLNLK